MSADDVQKVRHALAKARQELDAAEDLLAAMTGISMPPSPHSRRYIPPARRKGDPATSPITALADAPEWIATGPLAEFWGCHPNGILYYIDTKRLEAKKDGQRYLVSKASVIKLDAEMRAFRRNGRPPAA